MKRRSIRIQEEKSGLLSHALSDPLDFYNRTSDAEAYSYKNTTMEIET